MFVRRSTFWPTGAFVYRSGLFSAHATRLTAMPFIMMVVTTSCAPVFTFRAPGIAAYAIPPRIPNRSTPHISNGPGRMPPRCRAAQAAVTMATRYWPSTPMLKSPPLKQTETASAEKISGVAAESTHAGPSLSVVDARRIDP